jgi:L-asparagine permease
VLMAFDYPNGTWTVASIPVVVLLLVAGWYGVRRRAGAMMKPTIPSVTLTQSVLEDNPR